MNSGNRIKKQVSWALALALAFTLTLGSGQLMGRAKASPAPVPFNLSVQASQGAALPGNSDHAYFLVIVTDQNGQCVGGLKQTDFGIGVYYAPPGAQFGFGTKTIVYFNEASVGAYQIEVVLGGGTWMVGDYLAEFAMANGVGYGHALVKLSIQCKKYCALHQ